MFLLSSCCSFRSQPFLSVPCALCCCASLPLSCAPDEIVLCCYIINTSEYISETLPGLGERLSGLIEPPHNAGVDLSSVGDEYGAEISSAVAALVASMWTRLHRVLAGMTKLPWGAMSAVGDESAYVGQVAAVFREELPLVAGKLSPRYHPFFCNQVASTFIPRFVDAIYKCRSVGGVGAQQMSLDAHALKNVLLNVPSIAAAAIDPAGGKGSKAGGAGGAGGASSVAQKSYARYVNTEMSKAEALIKTLVSPNERLIVTFKALLPKSNVDDLMRVRRCAGKMWLQRLPAAAARGDGCGALDARQLPLSASYFSLSPSFNSAVLAVPRIASRSLALPADHAPARPEARRAGVAGVRLQRHRRAGGPAQAESGTIRQVLVHLCTTKKQLGEGRTNSHAVDQNTAVPLSIVSFFLLLRTQIKRVRTPLFICIPDPLWLARAAHACDRTC